MAGLRTKTEGTRASDRALSNQPGAHAVGGDARIEAGDLDDARDDIGHILTLHGVRLDVAVAINGAEDRAGSDARGGADVLMLRYGP